MEVKRRKFQGVLNILSFNRHFYLGALVAIALVITCIFLFEWSSLFFWFLFGLFICGLAVPLVVSAIVYDLSGFYNLNWLKQMKMADGEEHLNVNIHAGFDETSLGIQNLFSKSKLLVYDFYNADLHTEPAIVRARKVSAVHPTTLRISTELIPLDDAVVDHLFLFLACHEIRNHEERVRFLKECKRVCKPMGRIVVVEHLRDFPNFIAYSIGFTHFFSKTTWLRCFHEAGFSSVQEKKFTPFLSIFTCSL